MTVNVANLVSLEIRALEIFNTLEDIAKATGQSLGDVVNAASALADKIADAIETEHAAT